MQKVIGQKNGGPKRSPETSEARAQALADELHLTEFQRKALEFYFDVVDMIYKEPNWAKDVEEFLKKVKEEQT